jgi:spore coat protein A, manganese oxidase
MLSRRNFLKLSLVGGGALCFPLIIPSHKARLYAQSLRLLDPTALPKFTTPLVIPPVMQPTGTDGEITLYEIAVRQFQQQVLPNDYPMTTVWGYGSNGDNTTFNFPAFTVAARTHERVRVTWLNQLVDDPESDQPQFLPHLLPVDQTLHWANPQGQPDSMGSNDLSPYQGPVPIVTHVHGAHVAHHSDGHPEAWWLPDADNIPESYVMHGSVFASMEESPPGAAVFEYTNDQRAATLWYHDHALGITRLNVYAGMAGFWILRDGEEATLNLPGPAPSLGDDPDTKYYEIPIVIQDRIFNEDGSLFYPDSRAFFDEYEGPFLPEAPVSPIWNPEFFGNTMVVNGKTWPYLEVEPRLYRFRFLNGCNSRFLLLKFDQEVIFYQIGSEGGLLPDQPVELDQLLMAPAERADVIVDFSQFEPGTALTLLNLGPDEPFGGLPVPPDVQANPETTGQVMQFRVVEWSSDGNMGVIPEFLPPIPRLQTDLPARNVTLNEELYDPADVPIGAKLGTGSLGPLAWSDEPTETPIAGDTEIWNIINLTVDAHPIHLHLVQFQVVERLSIRELSYHEALEAFIRNGSVGNPPDPTEFVTGESIPPHPWERGWKDTVIANPGEITRIIARFDLPGLYVWHCHILEHEDNEMMRPMIVRASE